MCTLRNGARYVADVDVRYTGHLISVYSIGTALQLQICIMQSNVCNLTAPDWDVARSDLLRACEKNIFRTIYSNTDESHWLV